LPEINVFLKLIYAADPLQEPIMAPAIKYDELYVIYMVKLLLRNKIEELIKDPPLETDDFKFVATVIIAL
jgi:hypothetical protein